MTTMIRATADDLDAMRLMFSNLTPAQAQMLVGFFTHLSAQFPPARPLLGAILIVAEQLGHHQRPEGPMVFGYLQAVRAGDTDRAATYFAEISAQNLVADLLDVLKIGEAYLSRFGMAPNKYIH